MKHLIPVLALVLALLLAACAAPAAEPAAPTMHTPAPVAEAVEPTSEPTAEPTLEPVPTLSVTNDYSVKHLGVDTSAADAAGGIGAAKAEALAAKVYGNELAGRPQTYTCEGLAEYMGETYYSIYWNQLVEQHGVANNSYMGHFYVSLDGSEVLEGDADFVYPPIIGGG
ncbi:MAG: hypothetical protein VB051_11205 [Candidatus Pelethousia sp.]|nr:hypothetical protein [Candidatus Pelethousia sp.]